MCSAIYPICQGSERHISWSKGFPSCRYGAFLFPPLHSKPIWERLLSSQEGKNIPSYTGNGSSFIQDKTDSSPQWGKADTAGDHL